MKNKIDIYSNSHWIITGTKENFEWALNYKQLWGVQDKWFSQWKALEKDDIIFFYISDIKRIIGVGKIDNKFIQREPLWPDEISENKIKYPFRFEFTIYYSLVQEQWKNQGVNISKFIKENLGMGAFADLLRGGINFIRYENLVNFLYEEFEKQFNLDISSFNQSIQIGTDTVDSQKEITHSYLVELILQIGKMNKFLSVREYEVDNTKLDVIWRRVEKGSPTYVFEVQVSGDIYHALAKLKHAFDLWNSNIFLIITYQEDLFKVEQLLKGTFHEIKDKVKIIFSKDMEELFNRKKSWVEMERKMGIL